MRVSYEWLSQMLDLSKTPPDEVARILTSRGLEVEAIDDQAKGFEKVTTAKILEKGKHPQADRLSLCQVTTGKGDPLEIVCGATNMKSGDIVALAQVGASLPNGIVIKKSKIRGVTSNGMLCSESELGIADEAEGILILPEKTPIGRPLAEVLGRGDVVFELGITPNRGDCLSHIGIARELSSATGKKLKAEYSDKLFYSKEGKSPIKTKTEVGEQGAQFFGMVIEGVKIGPSPDWVQKRLESLGNRAINNVVDATNFVMLELGQPLHAYDLDKLKCAKGKKTMSIRMSKKGETLPLLDDTEVKLNGTELVISDDDRAVALAGVMGGGNSEVEDGDKPTFF